MNHADPTPQTERVLRDVTTERHRQIAKGWTPEHDDGHRLSTMVDLADARMFLATQALATPVRRKRLVEAAAILVAAIEALDRQEDL